MKIIIENDNRILIKENGAEVNINDGDIIQYTGIYYKTINDIIEMVNIETTFIGVVETCRSRYDNGIEGIYINPIYIFDILNSQWYKIVDLQPPKTKYFLYPHLLTLPQYNNYPSCYYPLYFLNTCENKSLDDFINIQKTYNLVLKTSSTC
jgi:hypothetical protein